MFSGHPHSAPLESSNSSEQTKQEIASFTSTLLDTPSLSPWNLLRVKHILAHVDQEGGYGGGALMKKVLFGGHFPTFSQGLTIPILLCAGFYMQR